MNPLFELWLYFAVVNMDSEKTTREFLISHFPLQNKTTNQETKNPPSVLHLKHKSSLFFLITSILNLIKSFKIAVHLGFFSENAVTCLTTSQGTLPCFSAAPGGTCRSWPPSWSTSASQALHLLRVKTQEWVNALHLHYTRTHQALAKSNHVDLQILKSKRFNFAFRVNYTKVVFAILFLCSS